MEWLSQPWPWYVSGPLIGLTVPLALLFIGKPMGVSSSLRHLNCVVSPNSPLTYLSENKWRKEIWNLIFVAGIALGGFIATYFLSSQPLGLLPAEYYTPSGMLKLLVGGMLVGFGARYADGCTSGHTLTGLAHLKWASLAATASFFAGGLLMMVIIANL